MAKGFEINLEKEGVFLKVSPDCSATITDILADLKGKGVLEYNGDLIKTALDKKLDESILIAPPQAEGSKEADFRMKISDDALTCEMWFIPPGKDAPTPTVQQVKGYMNERGVVFGHDESAIKNMIETPLVKQWVVTAKGNPPQQGKDAHIDYKVDLNILKPRAVGDKVDMKELGSVINVIKGQEIAEKIPVKPGKDGTSLMGKKIPAYVGKDKNLPSGKGTTISEDKLHLHAEYDGNLLIKDGKLSVNPVFQVKGDVDYSIGNIDFIGPVMIAGSVREGFDVKSGSDMQIDGVVEGASLSSKGDMSIRVGVRGMGRAKLSAKGDIKVGYIDQAFVRSDGNITVAEAILHSDIGARGDVTAAGAKKGQIVGGKVQAGGEVLCEVLGSEMGTKTEITVGVLPELVEEKKRATSNIQQFQEQLGKIDANVDFLKTLQQKGMLTEEKQALLAKITKAKFQIKAQYDATRKRLEELEADLEKNKLEGCVRVRNVCHPGVSITIRGVRYLVREPLLFTRFVYEDGEIKLKAFS